MIFYIQQIEYHAPVHQLHFTPLRPSFKGTKNPEIIPGIKSRSALDEKTKRERLEFHAMSVLNQVAGAILEIKIVAEEIHSSHKVHRNRLYLSIIRRHLYAFSVFLPLGLYATAHVQVKYRSE